MDINGVFAPEHRFSSLPKVEWIGEVPTCCCLLCGAIVYREAIDKHIEFHLRVGI
jgi:hypothetical protein